MIDYYANVAPFINTEFVITAQFGVYPSGGSHRGLDIASTGNRKLYSILKGKVINKAYDPSIYGNYISVKNENNIAFLYAHMAESSPLNVGDNVEIGTEIGIEGSTGNVTGPHLHLEMQNLESNSWNFGRPIGELINPAEYMGFPNELGATIFYNGTPIEPITKKKNFWKFFKKKINYRY